MPTSTLQVQDNRVRWVVTMASGISLSSGIFTAGYKVAALVLSSGWDAANMMTFRVSPDGTSYFEVLDTSGAEYKVASGAGLGSATGHAIIPSVDLARALAGGSWFKIQSGPSASPVNLTTGVTIDVMLRPLGDGV